MSFYNLCFFSIIFRWVMLLSWLSWLVRSHNCYSTSWYGIWKPTNSEMRKVMRKTVSCYLIFVYVHFSSLNLLSRKNILTGIRNLNGFMTFIYIALICMQEFLMVIIHSNKTFFWIKVFSLSGSNILYFSCIRVNHQYYPLLNLLIYSFPSYHFRFLCSSILSWNLMLLMNSLAF